MTPTTATIRTTARPASFVPVGYDGQVIVAGWFSFAADKLALMFNSCKPIRCTFRQNATSGYADCECNKLATWGPVR